MAVGRDDAPADGVVAVRKSRPERNDEGPHIAGLGVGRRRRHVVPLGARHRARDVLHLLVEVQHDLRRRRRDDRAGRRIRPKQVRVGLGGRREDDGQEERDGEGEALQRRLLKLTASATASETQRGRGKAREPL